jgi:hypothetical protein
VKEAEELVEERNLVGECFTKKGSLISEGEMKGTSFEDRSEATQSRTKRASKLNPVLMQLGTTHNCPELPLDLSIESISKPEPEKSDSMYDRLIHLNMKEENKDEINESPVKTNINNTLNKELTYTEDNTATINNSRNVEVIEERVSSLKKLLNKKYVESKLQSYTFTTDNEIKSVAALSIMPSKSFNLSEPSLINDERTSKKVQCLSYKEDLEKQVDGVEDMTNEAMNTSNKNNSLSAILSLKNTKTRNEVRSLYNFVKENYKKGETLSYDIERTSNEFYNKIMKDTNYDSNKRNEENLKERINEISKDLKAQSINTNIK